jgi:hypothetical protein
MLCPQVSSTEIDLNVVMQEMPQMDGRLGISYSLSSLDSSSLEPSSSSNQKYNIPLCHSQYGKSLSLDELCSSSLWDSVASLDSWDLPGVYGSSRSIAPPLLPYYPIFPSLM